MKKVGKTMSRPVVKENNTAQSLVLFIICFALFAGAVYSLSFLSLDNAWPAAVTLALFGLAFAIPQHVLGRSDTIAELERVKKQQEQN
ncbi:MULTISPECIES: hypothetical protein [Arthrobacter]|uniref:Uncharacterized protein n=3 Tax=Arthrobacter TaxID=1663 RepID=A0ABU9KKD4_9MICC|nr:hypothetical protein [Arthrobacter sp. YJM1]